LAQIFNAIAPQTAPESGDSIQKQILQMNKQMLENVPYPGTLKYLNVSGNEINFDDAKALGYKLEHNTSLLALKLHSCNLDIDSVIRILEGLSKNEHLESLDISMQSRQIDPYNLSFHISRYFSNSAGKNTLTRLNLSHLRLTDRCIHNLVLGLKTDNDLKHLDISCNKLSRDASIYISELLENNEQIQTLNLSHNRLEDAGIVKIVGALRR